MKLVQYSSVSDYDLEAGFFYSSEFTHQDKKSLKEFLLTPANCTLKKLTSRSQRLIFLMYTIKFGSHHVDALPFTCKTPQYKKVVVIQHAEL